MILIVPDKFKGSLTAMQVAVAVKEAIVGYYPDSAVEMLPLADGGDGSLEVVKNAVPNSESILTMTFDPLMRPINAEMLRIGDLFFIEMAKCCGLALLADDERNPENTTTFGLGVMIKNAICIGAKEIVIGIGGSATNDGGEGMLKALEGCLPLSAKIKVACDVTNPLLGKYGATMVYAPQKGADKEMLVRLEKRMKNFAKEAEARLRGMGREERAVEFATIPGGGAAGGIGAALYGFLNAELISGWKLFGEMVSLEEKIKNADIVITGEGSLDGQSLSGKLVDGVATLCRKYYRSLYVVCGINKLSVKMQNQSGIRDVLAISDYEPDLKQSMINASVLIKNDQGGKIQFWCDPDLFHLHHSELFPTFYDVEFLAGVDEAGRGPLAGPVYAGAVILPKGFYHPLLKDSKKLTEQQRDMMRIIIEKNAVAWCVASASPEEIDKLNILQASILAMHRALDGLKIRPEFILVDGNKFNAYKDANSRYEIPSECIVKGDSKVPAISAASILAKTHRDEYIRLIAKEFPQYGWDRNMAYPTAEHRAAIKKYGITKYHRRSFTLLK